MADAVLFDYFRSSASYRVRIALNLAGITFEAVQVDLLAGAQKSPAHLARNPQGLVPVLEIDGLRLTQSLAIIEYLDTTRELGLLPAEPARRALQQALAYAIAVDIHPVCNSSVAAHAVDITGRQEVRTAWMQRFIRPGLQAFDQMLAEFEQAPYCCGPQPGLADICLIPQLYNADRWNVPTGDLSRIQKVAGACAGHPAFAAAHPDRG